MISGALAGLAGGVVLTGQAYRITPTISNNIGWNGLLVALVARNNAWVAIVVALFFGALQAGGGFLATTGRADRSRRHRRGARRARRGVPAGVRCSSDGCRPAARPRRAATVGAAAASGRLA